MEIAFAELFNARTPEGQKVLEAGCGYAVFSKLTAERGAWVVSCDIAEGLVQRASRTASSLGVVGDACQLGVRDAAFGSVISSELVQHTKRPVEAVRELARVLKPGEM